MNQRFAVRQACEEGEQGGRKKGERRPGTREEKRNRKECTLTGLGETLIEVDLKNDSKT